MRHWLSLIGTVVVTSGLGVACGSSGDSSGKDSGVEPAGDAGQRKDVSADSSPDDAAKDSARRDTSADVEGETDGGEPDVGSVDAGPRCASSPTLLVSTSTLLTLDPPDSSVPVAKEAPSVAVMGDLYFVNDFLTGCEGPPPSLDAGPPHVPEAGCGGWTGSIWRMPVRGGKPLPVVSNMGLVGSHFLVTKNAVVFGASTETGKQPGGTNSIFSSPLLGGSKTTLATTTGFPGFLATDGTNVYFSDDGGVKSVPLTGGSPTLVTNASIFSFAPVGSNLVLADFSNDRVLSVPLGGGSTTTLATHQLAPLYPTACGSDTCWLNAGDLGGEDGGLPPLTGSLEQLVSGTTTTLAQSSSLFEPFGLAFDGTDFFVVTGSGSAGIGNLTKVQASDGTLTNVATFSPGTNGVAIDDECVYWSDGLGGIYSLAKSANGPFSVE
jgi:hypothetical protein